MTYNTEKRSKTVALLSENSGQAFSIEEIAARVRPDGKGKSSVYRIVAQLCREGAVRKITDAQSRHTTYQYLGGHECAEHLHLKCKGCGRLIHLDCETSRLLESKIMATQGFSLDEGALLFGKCEDCTRGGDGA